MKNGALSQPTNAEPPTKSRGSLFQDVGVNLALLSLSALLFTGAFPNPLLIRGFAPLAFIALVPIIPAIHRSGWIGVWFYGVFYGFVTYALFNYWLANFHPLAIFIVPTIYAAYFFLVFPALKLADTLFPRYGYLVQAGIWISYELLRTKGYLGYAYGIIGYSQYEITPLIQIAEIGGVWVVSLLVVLPSLYLGNGLSRGWGGLRPFLKEHRRFPALYLLLFVGTIAYGLLSPVEYSGAPSWKVALIQQNVDPWVGGYRAYENSFEALVRQSDLALEEDPDIVIWSETSFVPAIDYHTRYRGDQETYELVRRLTLYLQDKPVPFVIGNSDGQLVRNEAGEFERVDYNAVLLHDDGEFSEPYRKIHLVPFTEHFPYERQLPWMYDLLVASNTNFWEKGNDWTVFNAGEVRFSTPICFEDTFGYLSRGFVNEGAEVIVNLTNDSWSFSVPSAMQHMGMAVFRAVENRRTVVRSTNGGMTTTIDPNGRIRGMLPAFTEAYMVDSVPVYTEKTTLYTRFGDWFAFLSLISSALLLLAGVVWRVVRRKAD
ncbi:MAG: apolipoprotein N-acyltransferase [Alkalispirochaetaceae bacterium]